MDALQRALHFDAHDLELNQAGRLSASQRVRMGLRDLWTLFAGIVVAGVPLALLIVSFTGISPKNARGAGALVLIIALGGYLLWRGWLQAVDVLVGKVLTQEGRMFRRVQKGSVISSTRTYYYWRSFLGPEFRISKRAYEALVDGDVYRFSITPHSKRVVSATPAGQTLTY